MSAIPDSSEVREPPLIPDHQLIRCIGRGSYGTVWLARNMMGLYRAVKVVYRGSFADQRPFERELSGIRGFEPISRSHEGFMDVLQVGINEQEGYFYYVMELGDDQVSGQVIDPDTYTPKTLAREISFRRKLSLRECVELGIALSHALNELHRHGLVHRDIKPSNIIFVNGVPKLADIGLVAAMNQAHSFVGTEGFIPPEGPGTPQADVYSLGKVLYEASTGKDRQDFPELPTRLDELPDAESFLELNEVVLGACHHERSERYQSAWDLHAHLLVLANGKSVKRLKLLERRLVNLKRLTGVAAMALVVIAAIGYQGYREWERLLETRQRQVDANIAHGNQAMESGDLLGALPHFADALRLDKGNLNQGATHRLRFGSVLGLSPKLTQLWFAGAKVDDGEFSPDGQTVLITGFQFPARFYELETGGLYGHPFGSDSWVVSGTYSADGRFAVTASQEGLVSVWDVITLREVCHLPLTNRLCGARFSPDGSRIVTACVDGAARVCNWKTGRLELVLKQHSAVVRYAAFSHDGKYIVTSSQDGTAIIWDALTGQPMGKPLPVGGWVYSAAFSPDDRRIVTASSDRTAKVWEWERGIGGRILSDMRHGDIVMSAEFSPDGRLIITACLDGTARLWLAKDLQPYGPCPILKHGERVTHACFSPDGRRILTAGADGSVRIWDLAGITMPSIRAPDSVSRDGTRFPAITNEAIVICQTITGRAVSPVINATPSLESALLNRNGHFLLTISRPSTSLPPTNRLLQVWDTATGARMGRGLLLSNAFADTAISDDGKRVVIFEGKTAWVWEVKGGTSLSPPFLQDFAINAAVFSPDGNRIATTCGNFVTVWSSADGRTAFKALMHPAPVSHVEFSIKGDFIVSSCWDNTLDKYFAQVWDAGSGQPVGRPLDHGDGVLFASFSPDGTRVVTAGEDFKAIEWETPGGRQIAPPLPHNNKVKTATFSSDGRWILTASLDKTARIWSAESGDPLTPPLRHLESLSGATFMGDGRHLIAREQTGKGWVWELPVDEKPIDDIRKLARLLSGGAVAPSRELKPTKSEPLAALWKELRARYPSSFTVSEREIKAWHEFEEGESEIEHNWAAAIFQLNRLLELQPGDPSLINRLAKANEHLKSEHTQ